MAVIDRIPKQDARTRRALAGIGGDFVPYTGAEADIDLGSYDFTTTGLGTFAKIRANDKLFFTQTDENEYIDSLTDGELDLEATTAINLRINAVEQMSLEDGVFFPTVDSDVDFGKTGQRWKNGFIDTLIITDTLDVEGDTQLGNSSTDDTIGINVAPDANNLITAEFSESSDDATSYLFKATMTQSGGDADFGGKTVYGHWIDLDISGTMDGAASASLVKGLFVDIQDTSTIDGVTYRIYGGDLSASFTGSAIGTPTFEIYGLKLNSSGNIETGGITKHYGLRVSTSGRADNNYGIFIGEVSNIAGNKYAIWDSSGADWVLGADSQEVIWGEGQDAGILYDNTNFVLTPDKVGTGFVHVSTAQPLALQIGKGTAGVDYQIKFDGETNDGTITYMEDEDRFDFNNDMKVTGDIVVNGTITIDSTVKIPGATFWVEENGSLDATVEGGLQFAWGNGATGNWGAYQPVAGTVIGMSINVDTDTATVDTGKVQIALNGTAQGSNYEIGNPGSANSGSTVTFGTALAFSAGDRLTAITTTTPTGGSTVDVIITFWVVYD